jgi:hypothetical protein
MMMFDLSGFLSIPQSLKISYQKQWADFERIQAYNWTVSTLRNQGDKTQRYYIYLGNEEQNSFIQGNLLHVQRYPMSNWTPVSKD